MTKNQFAVADGEQFAWFFQTGKADHTDQQNSEWGSMFYYGRYDAKKVTLDLLSQNSKILQVATALQEAYENLLEKESELALQTCRDFLPMDEAASGAAHHYFSSVEGEQRAAGSRAPFQYSFQ